MLVTLFEETVMGVLLPNSKCSAAAASALEVLIGLQSSVFRTSSLQLYLLR